MSDSEKSKKTTLSDMAPPFPSKACEFLWENNECFRWRILNIIMETHHEMLKEKPDDFCWNCLSPQRQKEEAWPSFFCQCPEEKVDSRFGSR